MSFHFLFSQLKLTGDDIFLKLPGVKSILNLQEIVTRVKRLEIPKVIDAFSCLENIINIGGDKLRRNFYISFATDANSFLMYSLNDCK